MAELNKEQLERLAELARLELNPTDEDKMLKDFAGILEHFQQLQELPPRASQALGAKQFAPSNLRDDATDQPDHFNEPEKLIAQFPETEGRFNKIPPIFE